MIQKDKNESVKQNINQIIKRSDQIKYIIKVTLEYVQFTQQQYTIYCKNIFRDLTNFENKISKASLYEPDKTNLILKISRMYRDFPTLIQTYSEVNLIKLPHLNQLQELNKYSQQLKKKQDSFQTQFKNYLSTIDEHNSIYQSYLRHCTRLDQIISKFILYSDPLKFYNKSITSQYQTELENALHINQNQQTKVNTELQLLDSKRKFLHQIVKQIRQHYTSLFHNCLKFFNQITNQIIDSSKDHIESKVSNTRLRSELGEEYSKNGQSYEVEFERLNTFTSLIDEGNEIMSDFNELMKDRNSKKHQQSLLTDHKLFHVRCDNLKKRKVLAYLETLNLHENLVQIIQNQIKKYKEFQKNFKEKQKKIFKLEGKQFYRKQFQIYFGTKSFQLNQFCLNIIQMPRKSFQKINIWMIQNLNILKEIMQNKKQQISKFNKLYTEIMTEHLRQKQKYQNSEGSDTEISQTYRSNLVSSLDQFRYIFNELETKQIQKDKLVAEKMIQMHLFVTKQFNQCRIQNIIQKNQNTILKIKNFKITNEAMEVFKSDQLYSILYEDFFKQSLQKKFQSKINQKQFEQAQATLKQKQKIAKKMLKRQVGCCGFIKAQPIESQILSTYTCYLHQQQKKCIKGEMKILKQGLTFQESSWNICAQKVFILIPNSDIHSIDTKTLSLDNIGNICEGVSIQTPKGPLVFMTKSFQKMFEDLQKTFGKIYRKSITMDRKIAGKNDSTQSGSKTGHKGTSMIVGYNKQQNMFIQEPVCFNPSVSKVSVTKNFESQQYRLSAAHSSFPQKYQNEQSQVKKSKPKTQIQKKKYKQIRKLLQSLLVHHDKHQFLPVQFKYIKNKNYRSNQRKDYEFKDPQTYNQFLLKQLKTHKFIQSETGVLLIFFYVWKVSYPKNVSLHSFKHGQKIIIDLNVDPPIISVIEWPHLNEENFNRHFFYEKVKIMNSKIWNYIVQNIDRNFLYEQVVEKDYESSVDDSNEILNDEIRQIGQTFPEQLQFRASRTGQINQINEVNKNMIPSIQEIQLKGITPDQRMRLSSSLDTGQLLVRGVNM